MEKLVRFMKGRNDDLWCIIQDRDPLSGCFLEYRLPIQDGLKGVIGVQYATGAGFMELTAVSVDSEKGRLNLQPKQVSEPEPVMDPPPAGMDVTGIE